MRSITGLLVAIVLVLGLVLVGCGKPEPGAGGGAPPIPGALQGKAPGTGKHLQFGLVPKLLNNPVFEIADEGARGRHHRVG